MINIQRMVSCSHDNILASVRPGAHPVSLPCLALLALLLFASLAGTARAETYGDFTYATSNSCVTITGYKGAGGNVIIPPSIQNLPVSIIGATAFRFCSSITNVVIPESVTNIGDEAFSLCYRITTIQIPNHVSTIGGNAFQACRFTNIVIPASVNYIGTGAFGRCYSLKEIIVDEHNPVYTSFDGVLYDKSMATLLQFPNSHSTNCAFPTNVIKISDYAFSGYSAFSSFTIPSGVATIGWYAFTSCYTLTNIVIPESVTDIQMGAFYHCLDLKTFVVDEGNPVYSSRDGVLFDKRQTALLAAPTGRAGAYEIPNGTASIGMRAFEGCSSLTSVGIPSGITNVGNSAFAGCRGLVSLAFPNGVVNIGSTAFSGCTNLSKITFPDSVTNIGYGALNYCTGIKLVTLPKYLSAVQGGLFDNCTNLASVMLPLNATNIGNNAFYNCRSLANVTIPSGVTSIGSLAFYGCSGLTNVLIPNQVASIGTSAFGGCSKMTRLTLPGSVTHIQNGAFSGCTNLTSVYFQGNAPELGSDVFSGDVNATVYYQAGTTGWGETFGGRPTAIYSEPEQGFVQVTIQPEGVISVGAQWRIDNSGWYTSGAAVPVGSGSHTVSFSAMAGWTSPESQTIMVDAGQTTSLSGTYTQISGSLQVTILPFESLRSGPRWRVDGGAWQKSGEVVDGLVAGSHTVSFLGVTDWIAPTNQQVAIDISQTTLATGVYEECPFIYTTNKGCITITRYSGSDTTLTIPASLYGKPVTCIGEYVFRQAVRLGSITMPDSITNIGVFAFSGCTALTNINIPAGVRTLTNALFQGCSSLTSITIPTNVSYIGTHAFDGCASLTRVTIPNSLTNMGFGVFGHCTSLLGIDVDATHPILSSVGGVLFNKSQTMLVQCPAGMTGHYTIPDGVQTIRNEAFAGCAGLTNITIPSSVLNICGGTFLDCTSLVCAAIPAGVYTIHASTFSGCTSLKSVAIPDSVDSVSPSAFSQCTALKEIVVSRHNACFDTVDGVLFNKTLTTLVLCPPGNTGTYEVPSLVTSIGEDAFSGCTGLTNIIIPDSVTILGMDAFEGCTNLTHVSLGNKVRVIDDFAFYGCTSLADIVMPNSVATVGIAAFEGCASLTHVSLGNRVWRIGDSAFSDCTSLASITIPSSVSTIGDGAFNDCTGLTSVFYKGNAPYLVNASCVFLHAVNVTHYYIPGTTGWGSTYGTRPTAPWLPQLEPSALGTQTNGFGFDVHWASGRSVVVEACTNLTNPVWIPVGTNTLSEDTVRISDPDWAQYPGRFYRLQAR